MISRDKVVHWLCAILLIMVTNIEAQAQPATGELSHLSWMVGSWQGSLGPQTVEETWSAPHLGSMDTMIRLSGPDGVDMMELIVIREVNEGDESSLELHLRQFGPTLELRNGQDMTLEFVGKDSVSFVAEEGASIPRLAYKRLAQDHIRVEVTITTGDVLAAELRRI